MSLFHALAGILTAPSADCTFTASAIPNLNEFNVEPTNSFTHARLASDGQWNQEARTSNGWGVPDGTWQGGCPIAGYDIRWTRVSGDVPNSNVSGVDGVWQSAVTTASVGYGVTGTNILSGSFTLECRDATTLNVLFVDSFNMNCEVDPRN